MNPIIKKKHDDASHLEPIVSDKEQFKYRDPLGIIFLIVGTGGESVEPVSKTLSLASIYEGYGCINVE